MAVTAVSTEYVYSIQGAFPNRKVATDRLTQEIQTSSISTALDHIGTVGDDCTLLFKDVLSADDKTTLDGLIAVHSGELLPGPATTNGGIPIIALHSEQADKVARVVLAGRLGKEVIYATHDFTDKTSWYSQSVRMTDETLTDSGDGLTFTSSHPNWIDMTHGKIFDEDAVSAEVSHGYAISVTVDGIQKVQRKAFASTGGDYDVDYTNGKVTFFSPQTGVVKATYSYENGSTWIMRPAPKTILKIEEAEAQFSVDVQFNDTIRFGAWGLVDAFAPQLMPGVPSGTLLELEVNRYKAIDQIVDEARGSFPVIPPIGGSSGRGNQQSRYGFPFRYGAVKILSSKAGMELRVSLEGNTVFGGERATATFYCLSEVEV